MELVHTSNLVEGKKYKLKFEDKDRVEIDALFLFKTDWPNNFPGDYHFISRGPTASQVRTHYVKAPNRAELFAYRSGTILILLDSEVNEFLCSPEDQVARREEYRLNCLKRLEDAGL